MVLSSKSNMTLLLGSYDRRRETTPLSCPLSSIHITLHGCAAPILKKNTVIDNLMNNNKNMKFRD